MKRTVFVSAIRILCITLALTAVAPVLPGVEFDGSLLTAVLIGAGLWLTYEVTMRLSKKYFCISEGSCPLPSVVRKMMAIQVAASVVYVVVVGILLATPLTVSWWTFFPTGLLGLAGAMFASIVERFLRLS